MYYIVTVTCWAPLWGCWGRTRCAAPRWAPRTAAGWRGAWSRISPRWPRVRCRRARTCHTRSSREPRVMSGWWVVTSLAGTRTGTSRWPRRGWSRRSRGARSAPAGTAPAPSTGTPRGCSCSERRSRLLLFGVIYFLIELGAFQLIVSN